MQLKGVISRNIVPIVVVLLSVLGVLFLLSKMGQHRELTNAQAARKAGKPIPVETHKISSGDLNFFIPVECMSQASAVIPMHSRYRPPGI